MRLLLPTSGAHAQLSASAVISVPKRTGRILRLAPLLTQRQSHLTQKLHIRLAQEMHITHIMHMNTPIPQKLKTAREAAGCTQTQAAALCDVSLRTWQQWEKGETEPHRFMLAGALAELTPFPTTANTQTLHTKPAESAQSHQPITQKIHIEHAENALRAPSPQGIALHPSSDLLASRGIRHPLSRSVQNHHTKD